MRYIYYSILFSLLVANSRSTHPCKLNWWHTVAFHYNCWHSWECHPLKWVLHPKGCGHARTRPGYAQILGATGWIGIVDWDAQLLCWHGLFTPMFSKDFFFLMFFVDVFSIVLRLVFLYSKLLGVSNFASLGARMQWIRNRGLRPRLAPYAGSPATGHWAINPSLKGPGSHRKKGGPSDRSQQSFGLLPHLGRYFFEVLGIDWVRMFSIKPSKGWYSTPQSPSHSKKIAEAERPREGKNGRLTKKRLLSWSR